METSNNSMARSIGGQFDIITGGFPCQPFSVAGNRKGKNDDRYLWPEMLRVIGEISPTFIVGENVSGSWELVDEICSSLESLGYKAEPIGIDSASLGADHKRFRYWFTAYAPSIRLEDKTQKNGGCKELLPTRVSNASYCDVSSLRIDLSRSDEHLRRNDVISNWVDRIRSIGNAVDPQVAFEIFKAIESSLPPK